MTYSQEVIARIRSFNRFYTNIIGLLDQHFLNSPFSLTEGRALYEICSTEECSAKKIRESIVIDEGYLSRILDNFVKRGLIKKTRSPADGRLWIIVPTEKGKREFILDNFVKRGLIKKTRSPADGRLWIIVPTEKGKREFANLNDSSNRLIAQMIEKLSEQERADLLIKMEGIRTLLEKAK